MEKALTQKNTLLKNPQANAEVIFLREYFFSHPRKFFATLPFFNKIIFPNARAYCKHDQLCI